MRVSVEVLGFSRSYLRNGERMAASESMRQKRAFFGV
jgi:hypothetical protein